VPFYNIIENQFIVAYSGENAHVKRWEAAHFVEKEC
jgi:hypothetical protein